jgi:IS30 family transposase
MPRTSELSDTKLQEIHRLKFDEGLSVRRIAEQLGITKSQVETALSRPVVTPKLQEQAAAQVTALLSTEEGQEAQYRIKVNVFDIQSGLQEVMDQTTKLLSNSKAPLKEQVAVRAEMRQTLVAAANIVEKTYNSIMFNEVLRTIFAAFAEESPETQRRIYERLASSPATASLIGLLADNRDGEGPEY